MLQGVCKLCLQAKDLQNSHFFPRGMYRALMDVEGNNPNPVHLTTQTLVQKSQHIRDHVLCRDCEQLLNRNGENWVVRNAFNGTEFRLRDLILHSQPISPTDDARMVAYPGAEISQIDMAALVYFGVSLFWRASVHKWQMLDGEVYEPLGQLEEVLRRYLLGERHLPEDITVHVFVSPRQEPWRSFCVGPNPPNSPIKLMLLAGLMYVFRMDGVTDLDREHCAYHSARGVIFTSTTLDDMNGYVTLSTYLKQSGLNSQASVQIVL